MVSATFWLLLTTAVGVLESFKFTYPDFATVPWLSFGRLRPIHTNIHLYEPHSLVAESIMFAYKWLFVIKDHADPGDVAVQAPPDFAPRGKVVVASKKAIDLVLYLKSLKQAPLPAVSATP